MPGPFPGMGPWLEAPDLFPGVQAVLITYLWETLNSSMPAGYVATTNNRVWVDDTSRSEPDVGLFGPARPPRNGTGAGAALAGLLVVGEAALSDPWEEPELEIRSDRGKGLVTAVEVLSPSNKRAGSPGRKAYQDKQQEARLAGASLVEIDLLRSGTHTTAVPLGRLRQLSGGFDYHVSVVAAGERPTYYAAPIRLADRLPAFAVPLDPGVPAVTVDLQPLLDRLYDAGRYPDLIDNRRPGDPPLTPDQQAWAEGILKAGGLLP